MELSLIFVVCLASFARASGPDVVELNPSNFDKLVLNSDELWMVEFYAPWCGHCKALEPEWSKAATALKGVVKVGAVDADQHRSLGGQYGVQGFPTIKIFGLNKRQPSDYQGARQANAIVDEALNAAKRMVKDRQSGKKSSGGGGGRSSGSGKKADPEDVVELTDSNFKDLVLESDDMWLVEFFAPWCGHCKNLAPHWAQAATDLKGKVKLGALDATVHKVMASRYGIQGFPTIKFFPSGKKDSDSAQEYDGGRTASDIVSWAMTKWEQNAPPPEVYEVTSQDVLENNCEGKQLCIVAILPHILDCQSKCRNDYLDVLRALGEKYKNKMWGWLWAEGASQLNLESALEIGGFGYPAMAALNIKKWKFSILKGSFDKEGINDFLRALSVGRGSIIAMKKEEIPKVVKTAPWDGKDGEPPQEEDIDLSDVELDDLDKDEL